MDVLKEAAQFLEARGVESPRLNAERLLAQVLRIGRVDLYLQFDQPLSLDEREAFKAGLRRRAAGEPLQYILGETEFMSLDFAVNPAVLIPRPETEILVEAVLNRFDAATPVRMLDIGTGSGAIAVSLAHYLPEAQITAVDLSPNALEVAWHNGARHGVADRIQFVQADLYDPELSRKVGGPLRRGGLQPPLRGPGRVGGPPGRGAGSRAPAGPVRRGGRPLGLPRAVQPRRPTVKTRQHHLGGGWGINNPARSAACSKRPG